MRNKKQTQALSVENLHRVLGGFVFGGFSGFFYILLQQ